MVKYQVNETDAEDDVNQPLTCLEFMYECFISKGFQEFYKTCHLFSC